jgi:hypothetical protein
MPWQINTLINLIIPLVPHSVRYWTVLSTHMHSTWTHKNIVTCSYQFPTWAALEQLSDMWFKNTTNKWNTVSTGTGPKQLYIKKTPNDTPWQGLFQERDYLNLVQSFSSRNVRQRRTIHALPLLLLCVSAALRVGVAPGASEHQAAGTGGRGWSLLLQLAACRHRPHTGQWACAPPQTTTAQIVFFLCIINRLGYECVQVCFTPFFL